jgi:hypothetical protein
MSVSLMSAILTFSGSTVTIGDQTWEAPFPIRDGRFLDGCVLLIYDYMCGPRGRVFYNFEAFDAAGKKLWTAENPGNGPADAYVSFMSDSPLVAWHYACFRCTIDPQSGRLLHTEFTK